MGKLFNFALHFDSWLWHTRTQLRTKHTQTPAKATRTPDTLTLAHAENQSFSSWPSSPLCFVFFCRIYSYISLWSCCYLFSGIFVDPVLLLFSRTSALFTLKRPSALKTQNWMSAPKSNRTVKAHSTMRNRKVREKRETTYSQLAETTFLCSFGWSQNIIWTIKRCMGFYFLKQGLGEKGPQIWKSCFCNFFWVCLLSSLISLRNK